jgi:hypothetical protein
LIGCVDSSAVKVGSIGPPCTVGGRPTSTHRMANYFTVEDLAFQVFDSRDRTLLQAGTVGSACVHLGKHTSCHLQSGWLQLREKSGIPAIKQGKWDVLQACTMGSPGPLCTWKSRPSGAPHKETGYSSLSEESGIFVLLQGRGGSATFKDSGECLAAVDCGRQPSQHTKRSKILLHGEVWFPVLG